MSGGRFCYTDSQLRSEMFGWDGDDKPKNNPYMDWEVSQLMYDLLNLTHDLDWFLSGDTGRDTYRKSLNNFKTKWLNGGNSRDGRLIEIVDGKINELRNEIVNMITNGYPMGEDE